MRHPVDIRKIQQFCSEYTQIAAAYLFGSSATGKDRSKSDIDLAIMVNPKVGAMERVEMETILSSRLHRDVDLVIFNQGSPLLQHQVLKYGKLVYEAAPKERVRQEVYARKAYFDTAFLYRKIKPESAHGGH